MLRRAVGLREATLREQILRGRNDGERIAADGRGLLGRRLVEVERKYLEAKAAVEKVTEEIEAEEDAAELPVEFENSRTSYREHVPFEVKARVVAGRVSPAKGL